MTPGVCLWGRRRSFGRHCMAPTGRIAANKFAGMIRPYGRRSGVIVWRRAIVGAPSFGRHCMAPRGSLIFVS